MLTRRGFWLLFGALAAFIPAALTAQLEAVVVPLGVLLWFGFQWTLHLLRATYVVRRLQLSQTVGGRTERRAVRWAGRPVDIQLELRNPTPLGIPCAELRSFVPSAATVIRSKALSRQPIAANGEANIEVQLRFERPGIFWLEGLRVEIVEAHGFFKSAWFIEDRIELLVLPGPAVLPGVLQTRIADDRRLGQGAHRLRVAGSSCELLEIRPYRPGDAPRSIAWKVSARRENLMTRDYEAEVPVRCTLILDASRPMRIGESNRTPLIQASQLLSTLAHRWMSIRDPVGLSIVDDHRGVVLKPGVGTRHLTRIQTALAKAAALTVGPTAVAVSELLEPVVAAAEEFRPQWLRPTVNRPEAWWRGVRVFSVRGIMASALMPVVASVLFMGRFFFVFCLLVAAILFLIFGPKPGLTGRLKRLRKTAASVLAMDSGGGPEAIARFMTNDGDFSAAGQQFLERWNRPYPIRLVDRSGKPIFEDAGKFDTLARGIRSVAVAAREREVIVIVADFVEDSSLLKPVLDALRIATARGHLPIVVYVWPESLVEYPGPPARPASVPDSKIKVLHDFARQVPNSADRLAATLDRAALETGRHALTTACRKLGVSCIPLTHRDRPAAIVRRIERIRQAASQRAIAR